MSAEPASTAWPRICVVGPLPPPSGGMANQCEQLVRLLAVDGVRVALVRTNSPYRPVWVGRLPMVRALFRLLPYLGRLWQAVGQADLVHVLSNSGWAWHLLTTPVLVIASIRRRPVIVNYRGGNADSFFRKAPRHVLASLRLVALRVTPSAFLQRVFQAHGLDAEIVPNIVDLTRFAPSLPRNFGDAPHLVVTRNLELIYDMPTALRAFAVVRDSFPGATLTMAGTGPELQRLKELSHSLGLAEAVNFPGRIDNHDMPALYARADCALNPSTVDNMPISVLEAFASGVPVVSTSAGGIPDLVSDGVTGLLVPIGDAQAMADATLRVLRDADLRHRLTSAALREARQYAWPEVRERWRRVYARVAQAEGSA